MGEQIFRQRKFKDFFENYEVFYKSKFVENKLVGFIKNDKSWHDVSEFKRNFERKSLNINLIRRINDSKNY